MIKIKKKHFSLAEVMIGVAIIGALLLPLIFMNMRSQRVSMESRYRVIANKLVKQKLEEFKFMDFIDFCELVGIDLANPASAHKKEYTLSGDFTGLNDMTSEEYPEEYARYSWEISATPSVEYDKITHADLKVKVLWYISINGADEIYNVDLYTMKVNPYFVRLPDKNKK